jgi:potassium-transporting ATPase KdpC subunit
MRRQLAPAVVMFLLLTVVCGVVYPAVVTAAAQLGWSDEADGSLVRDADGTVIGSALLAQGFTEPRYFHPRPSAAGDGYDGAASSASNLGPSSEELHATVEERAVAYREENDLPPDAEVPVDAVTASGSGLDPAISVANARLQAPRVAEVRGLDVDDVLDLVDEHTTGRTAGFIGETTVEVLALNLALDGRG